MTIVMLPATLIGMGHTARCEVLVHQHPVVLTSANSKIDGAYTDCSIIHAPDNLPDGEYTVRFRGFRLTATYHGGLWLPHGEAQRDTAANEGPLSRAS